jgi:molybdenum cofactor synthesis domain-containing protein
MSEAPKIVTAAMLVIGNEILSGRTKDANLAWIAERLAETGVRLMEARVVPDIEAAIVKAVRELSQAYDYVFTSGGIGPTHDDITADAIARAFDVGIDVDPRARAILDAHYPPGELTPARLRMARIPFGADLIENPVSKAPGFRIGNVHVMAGVPTIFREMFKSLRHTLVGGDPLVSRAVGCPMPEGKIAEPLGALQKRYADIDIGSYPFFRPGGRPGTTIVFRGVKPAEIDAAAEEFKALVRSFGEEPFEAETA